MQTPSRGRLPGREAERVAVPRANLVPKPAGLSFVDATSTLVAHLVIALYYCFDQLTVRERQSATQRAG